MSKTKHTPGPWHVAKDGSLGTIEAETGQVVAQAQQLSALAGLDKVRLANAQLIAAAPCLLEACMQWISERDNPAPCWVMKQDAERKMRAAIAKATHQEKWPDEWNAQKAAITKATGESYE